MKYPYPVMYKNVYKYDDMKRGEHMAVRNTVGWYLWTHQLVEVEGPDATAFLEGLFPKNIGNLKIGSERYTTMLNDKAEIIDDVVIFRMGEEKYWVSTLFKLPLMAWFQAHKGEKNVAWQDITGQWEMYAVQGPRSRDMVNAIVKNAVDEQKFFTIRENEWEGKQVLINRAGFTGEKLGYEIYIAKADGPALEAKLRELAPQFAGREVTEFQIMAWTLPTEAGFFYMRDLAHTNPAEVGLEGGFNYDKEFVGKEAMQAILAEGAKREVWGFTVEDVDIHIKGRNLGNEGEFVYTENGEYIGRCMKITYSYVKEINNGTVIVKKGAVKPGDVVTMHGHKAVICAKSFL